MVHPRDEYPMTTQISLEEMIVELLAAYPIDPSEGLLQAGLQMEYGVSTTQGKIRFAAAKLARAGEIDVVPRAGGSWRYSISA